MVQGLGHGPTPEPGPCASASQHHESMVLPRPWAGTYGRGNKGLKARDNVRIKVEGPPGPAGRDRAVLRALANADHRRRNATVQFPALDFVIMLLLRSRLKIRVRTKVVRSEISKVYGQVSGLTAVHARASRRLLWARHQGPRGQTVATGVESEGCGYGGPTGWGITSRVGPA
jgi:hypothetical protein